MYTKFLFYIIGANSPSFFFKSMVFTSKIKMSEFKWNFREYSSSSSSGNLHVSSSVVGLEMHPCLFTSNANSYTPEQ
jgi:hypothetical protein